MTASAGWRMLCGPKDVREQLERQLKELQEAYREAMLESCARDESASLLGKEKTSGGHYPAGIAVGED